MMRDNNMIGKRVLIKCRNTYKGKYGTITYYDGWYYHIRIDDVSMLMPGIFERHEFAICK